MSRADASAEVRIDAPGYRHTQVGWAVVAICGIVALVVAAALVNEVTKGRMAWTDVQVWIGPAVLGVAAALFGRQTVEIDSGTLRWYFGPGIWTNEVHLVDIQSVRTFTYSPLAGYGIRWTRRGWLYNVSGTHAVEIATTDTTFAIGTDEPERLKAALEKAAPSLS